MRIGKVTNPELIRCQVDDLPAEIEVTFERDKVTPYTLNVATRAGQGGTVAIVMRLDEHEADALVRALSDLPREDLKQREHLRYHPDA